MRQIALLAVMMAVGYGAWLHHRATEHVAALITQLRPHVLLRYETLSAWPWRDVRLHQVMLEPVGSWREGLNLPVGYRLNAAELRWRRPDAVTGDSGINLLGLRVPVEGWPAAAATPLQRTGIDHIDGDLQLQLTPPLRGAPWQVTAQWRTDHDLILSATATASVGPRFPALDPTETLLLSAQLEVEDRGLLTRVQQSEALASRRSVDAWADKALSDIEHSTQQAEWPLSDAVLANLESLLQRPRSFTVHLTPPAPARLAKLNLYAPSDRWPLLGLTLEAQ